MGKVQLSVLQRASVSTAHVNAIIAANMPTIAVQEVSSIERCADSSRISDLLDVLLVTRSFPSTVLATKAL